MIIPIYMHNDNAYIVKRTKPIHWFMPDFDSSANLEIVKAYKEWIGADHVLRTSEQFIFVDYVEDIEYEIIETKET